MTSDWNTLIKGIDLGDVIQDEEEMQKLINKAYLDAEIKYASDIKQSKKGGRQK